MATQLADLDRALRKERDRRMKRKPKSIMPEPAKAAPVTQQSFTWPKPRAVSRAMPRTLALPVDYAVPGPFAVLAQPTANSCWATVFTMMYSWKKAQSMAIETALAEVGERWLNIFRADTGLSGSDKADFVATVGLQAEPPSSLSIEGWEQLLRTHGPIWVTTDEAPGKAWAIHARIIIAIHGDGTPEGTSFTIIDPAGGRQYDETIATFIPKYEEEVRRTGYMRIQILYWPADARYAAQKSMWSRRASTARSMSYAYRTRAFDETLEDAIARLQAEGVPQDQIAEFVKQINPMAVAQSYRLAYPMDTGGVQVHLPQGYVLEGWKASLLLAALPIGPIKLLIPAIQALCTRLNVTVGIGPAITGGFAVGLSGAVGVLFAPNNQVGFYGTYAGVVGAIVSISATMQVTVIHGGPEKFGGSAVAVGVSIDLDIGPNIGAHALLADGKFIGVTGEVGLSAGLSPFEAFAQFQHTSTTMSAIPKALQLMEALSANDIPLDPGVGGQSIGVDALDVGDIILSTTPARISGLIRWATDSEVSHSMLYIGNGEVVEAIGEGVVRRSLNAALADASVAVAFRYPDLSAQQADQIRTFAIAQVGKSYDKMGIVRQALFQLDKHAWCNNLDGTARDRCIRWVGRVNLGTGSNDKFFCSELVVAAYQNAGVPLTDTPPSWTSPEDLAEMRFTRLGYVGHLKTP